MSLLKNSSSVTPRGIYAVTYKRKHVDHFLTIEHKPREEDGAGIFTEDSEKSPAGPSTRRINVPENKTYFALVVYKDEEKSTGYFTTVTKAYEAANSFMTVSEKILLTDPVVQCSGGAFGVPFDVWEEEAYPVATAELGHLHDDHKLKEVLETLRTSPKELLKDLNEHQIYFHDDSEINKAWFELMLKRLGYKRALQFSETIANPQEALIAELESKSSTGTERDELQILDVSQLCTAVPQHKVYTQGIRALKQDVLNAVDKLPDCPKCNIL